MAINSEEIVVLDAGFVGGPDAACCAMSFNFITK